MRKNKNNRNAKKKKEKGQRNECKIYGIQVNR